MEFFCVAKLICDFLITRFDFSNYLGPYEWVCWGVGDLWVCEVRTKPGDWDSRGENIWLFRGTLILMLFREFPPILRCDIPPIISLLWFITCDDKMAVKLGLSGPGFYESVSDLRKWMGKWVVDALGILWVFGGENYSLFDFNASC